MKYNFSSLILINVMHFSKRKLNLIKIMHKVLQGYVPWPILFLWYINNLYSQILSRRVFCWRHNISIVLSIISNLTVLNQIWSIINKIFSYLQISFWPREVLSSCLVFMSIHTHLVMWYWCKFRNNHNKVFIKKP